jgi:hypothetical protein
MSRLFVLLAILLLVPACQPSPKPAAVAAGPTLIEELKSQTVVYECPQCGMDYDGPGVCSMDNTTLVKTGIEYICPADNRPVEHSGKCPRCAANATVKRTALAADAGGGN